MLRLDRARCRIALKTNGVLQDWSVIKTWNEDNFAKWAVPWRPNKFLLLRSS